MFYKTESVKDNLTIEHVYNLLEALDAEPRYESDDRLVCKSICHGGNHHKLVYFAETGNFFCRSNCGAIGDIFTLLSIVMDSPNFNEMVNWVVENSGIDIAADGKGTKPQAKELDDIAAVDNLLDMETIKPAVYESNPIKHYPFAMPQPWLDENIDTQVCKDAGIKINPLTADILIPHYSIDGELIGIKTRTLIKEAERHDIHYENGSFRPAGKYQQFRNAEQTFSVHNNLSLYGMDYAKDKIDKGAIVIFEAEKSVLKLRSANPDAACVSCNGSFISKFQMKQLLDCGVQTVYVAFDRDYARIGDKEYYELLDKYIAIADKYNEYFNLRFIVDTDVALGLHDSPIDCGYDTFKHLIKHNSFQWHEVLEKKCGLNSK